MGPVSPALTPSSVGSSGIWVVLAWAVGAGFKAPTGRRGSTSKRGMGCVNAWTPNSGLRGKPVGIAPHELLTNGLRPLFATITPPALNRPHLSNSRREIWPSASALLISRRFARAFCASLNRDFDVLIGRYMDGLLLRPRRIDILLPMLGREAVFI